MKDSDMQATNTQAGGAYLIDKYYKRIAGFRINLACRWDKDEERRWILTSDYRIDVVGQNFLAWVPLDDETPEAIASAFRQLASALDKLERKNPQA